MVYSRPVSRIYRATFRCHHPNGTLVEPSLHYQTDLLLGQSEPDPSDVAAKIWSHLGNFFPNTCPSDVTIDELIVGEEVLKPDIGVTGSVTIAQQGTFTIGTDRLPLASVAVVDLRTKTRSRSARGWHMLAGGIPANQQNQGKWGQNNSYWTAALLPWCSVLSDSMEIGSVNPSTIHPVIYSRTRHRQGFTPYTFRVTSAAPNPEVRWLRRRLSSP